jgi:UDP-glucose 4-epimerase
LYLPVDEVHPISPVDINGIHKVAAEWYYKLYDDVHGIRSCSLRLTNTIGPRMRIKDARQTFLGIWIKMLLENKPIEVWGGEQLRDFNDVEDVVDAMMIAAFHDGASGNVFNLGSEEVVSLKELAQLMITIKGDGKFSITPYPEDRKPIDIGDYYGSFEKFSSVTGWRPTRKLAHTLERTLDYYGKNFQHYVEDAAPYRS